jgi:hypothetical protein
MASDVDICNLALSHVANDANITSIDPPDPTVEADHCARFYPIVRDQILESHAWRFATRRIALAELAVNPVDHWAFAYGVPAQLIRPLAILQSESTDDTQVYEFAVEITQDGTDVIYTNIEDAVLKYIGRVTDPGKFTPMFVVAFSYLLAYYVAGPLTKDLKLKQSLMQYYMQVALPQAQASDANGQRVNAYSNFTPSQVQARGYNPSPWLAPGRIIR